MTTTKATHFAITQPQYNVVHVDESTTLDQVVQEAQASDRPVLLRREGQPDMTLLPAADLDAVFTELHLLSSPENARRLLESIEEARSGRLQPRTIEAICEEFGFDPAQAAR